MTSQLSAEIITKNTYLLLAFDSINFLLIDLGVIVDDRLKFHSHAQGHVAKANQALELIK